MITEEQRQLRRKYIGSSDAAAIMGVDPYRSASDVYLEKTGQADGFEGNANTERGNILEPVLLDWAEKELGRYVCRSVLHTLPEWSICCNFDGLVGGPYNARESVEAKTATNVDEWGAEGTDEIPTQHIIQIHQGFAVMPTLRVCWVPVLLAGFRSFDWRMYKVERNEDLAQAVANAGRTFWREHVEVRIQPADFRPSLEILKRMRREPTKIVPLAVELADRLVVARAACKQAEEEKEEAERSVLTALADAEGGDLGDGRLITYMTTTRKAYEVKEAIYRTLRIKPAKGTR